MTKNNINKTMDNLKDLLKRIKNKQRKFNIYLKAPSISNNYK